MSILKYKVKPDNGFGYEAGTIIELDKRSALEFADDLELVRDADGVAHTIPNESRKLEFVLELEARVIKSLRDAGFVYCGEVAELPNADLLAIEGIGPGAFSSIRHVLGGGEPIPDDPDSEPDESEIKIVELEVE